MPEGLTLDTGALIAAERGVGRMIALLLEAERVRLPLAVPAGVLAQAWRADPRQHRLHLLLADDLVSVVPLDRDEALAVGSLCAATGTSDVVDASVVTCARTRAHAVITSDPADLRRLDPELTLIAL